MTDVPVRFAVGYVVRVLSTDDVEQYTERFTRGDWKQDAWARAAEFRLKWPEWTVKVEPCYD